MLARAGLVQFRLPAPRAFHQLEQCRTSRTPQCVLAAREPEARLRWVTACFWNRNIALAGGGPNASDEQLLGIFERFEALARRLHADLAHAFIDIGSSFGPVLGVWPGSWKAAPELVESVCDELLFDAFPYQILGPRHLNRLGGAPAGAKSLPAGGRVELSIGDPLAWLSDGAARDEQRAAARELLSPCLVDDREAYLTGAQR